jgi:outer membrane protein insertion porin family
MSWPVAAQTKPAAAQPPSGMKPYVVCGGTQPAPAKEPPAGSGPIILAIAPCFEKQGGTSVIEPETYLFYIQTRGSQPSQDRWVAYDAAAEQRVLEDFRRLWGTNFLTDLSIVAQDYAFPNGVVGKLIVYNMEERERIKIVNYTGSKQFEQTKLEEKMRDQGVAIRLDSFVDDGQIRRVKTMIRELLAEKGYQDVSIEHQIKPVEGGPKLVNLTFVINEGPKIRIERVDFVGNKAFEDGTLKKKMKENKERGFLSFITGGGTYQEAKFEEDAEKVQAHYRNNGYIYAQVGQPELKTLSTSSDGKTRRIELRIPVEEGDRYRVGDVSFDGNTVLTSAALRPFFKVEKGDFYSQKRFVDGINKIQELYGAGGYMEFTAVPTFAPAADPAPGSNGSAPRKSSAPEVDVAVRVQEGKQYFVNRITFLGNTTTRDNVIRREVRLYENNVFDTNQLKNTVKRLNQLGYFKPIEDQKNIQVDKTPGSDNKVDVTLKFEEQNRNQLTFGAGVSQYDGVFVQLGFQTANFMGRGETLGVNIQTGARAHNYQVAFTEPYLFDRPITGGVDVYNREIQYVGQFTQASRGGNLVFGWPLADFTRAFVQYSYEQVTVKDFNEAFLDPSCIFSEVGCSRLELDQIKDLAPELLRRNPFLYDSLLIGQNGYRTVSKITPSVVYNTVDQPIFPTSGKRLSASIDLAGIGGNTNFIKPQAEFVSYFRHTSRTTLGMRAQIAYLRPHGSTAYTPIFENLYLGGGYSIRGYDIRSIGPADPQTGLVIGGNKSLLFNVEYLITIAGPVRLVLFADAGQVRARGVPFSWKMPVLTPVQVVPWVPSAGDGSELVRPLPPDVTQVQITGETGAFKTSSGAEIRFFMPVLNVPFRLIFAYNGNREGVLDNNLQQEKAFKFRFDVGTTF